MTKLRLSYPTARPFSARLTVVLCVLYLCGFCGLLVFNFLTQAKALHCTSSSSGVFDQSSCEPSPLEFARTYYTRPVDTNALGHAGIFPWTPLGFGSAGDTGPVDYSVLSTNWTAQPLSCAMFEQVLTLHLDSGGWTVASCYYCGSTLRILCTTLDSERTQIAGDGNSSRVDLGGNFTLYRNQLQAIATSSYSGGIILSARMIVKRALPAQIVDGGVLPYSASTDYVVLGTSIGSSVVYSNDSNSGLAAVARNGHALSTLAEQATSEDLQPSGVPRTLQASYICRQCQKQYKPTIEIIAVVGAAIFAVLTPAFAVARMLAQLVAEHKDEEEAPVPDPSPYAAFQKPAGAAFASYSYGSASQHLPYSPGLASSHSYRDAI